MAEIKSPKFEDTYALLKLGKTIYQLEPLPARTTTWLGCGQLVGVTILITALIPASLWLALQFLLLIGAAHVVK